jgi:uncharacterized tellurite resistance protein B-like protein|tara:strand:+ start:869 stop:1300 length:432 start_codon:yes stop_codon:yes gene_type:complete
LGFFSRDRKLAVNNPEDMSPLESVTHLFAAIQIADQQASYEEKESWVNAISKLFPEHSSDRAENFFNEAHSVLKNQNSSDRQQYLRSVLNRVRTLLSKEQLESLGPMIAHIVEADGIVMTSEMEIVYLAEEILSIKINVDEDD